MDRYLTDRDVWPISEHIQASKINFWEWLVPHVDASNKIIYRMIAPSYYTGGGNGHD